MWDTGQFKEGGLLYDYACNISERENECVYVLVLNMWGIYSMTSFYKASHSGMLMLPRVIALTVLNPLALLLTGMTYLSVIILSNGKQLVLF